MLVILLALALIPTAIPIFSTASAATAYTEINGTLNGANYTIRIPNPIEAWNHQLVMFCHGYSHTEPTRPLIKASDGSATWANGMISVGYCIRNVQLRCRRILHPERHERHL